MNEEQTLDETLQKLQNMHYPTGPAYSRNCKLKALLCMQNNEIEAAYNLAESHAPNLRFTAVHRYEKALQTETQRGSLPLNKEHFNFRCNTVDAAAKTKEMLQHLNEMPEEWTLVQLTSQFNHAENLEVNPEKFYTSALHVTVFNSDKLRTPPFVVTLQPPKDSISGKDIEIRQEMHSIIVENSRGLENFKNSSGKFLSQAEKKKYCGFRLLLNNRLQNLVTVISNKWLAEWRCLLTAKYVNDKIEKVITSEIENVFADKQHCNDNIKNRALLKCLTKAKNYLSVAEIKSGLQHIFPDEMDKELRILFHKMINSLSKRYNLCYEKRHPLILIIDEKLDFLPWEMIDVLHSHPVSRMPSLHFTYALFKEHENTIVNGWKTNIDSKNGTYIINPSSDLKRMETRLCSFFNYWLPNWSGLVGVTPSEAEFQRMLTENEIFVYSGHGNGTQFLAGEKIQKLRVNAVVLLFGCGSVQLLSQGPQVEMHSSYHMYLIACSPCTVGMLWTVTDIDTDTITTEFLSLWVPSKVQKHWKLVDKKKWEQEGSVHFESKKIILNDGDEHEPELLRALCKAKIAAKQYIIQAACVARGLPVRIV